MRSSLRLLLRRRSYRALWLADLASLIGDWFSVVAVSVVAGAAAGSAAAGALALATVLATHLLPQALFAPVAGVLADPDRWSRPELHVEIETYTWEALPGWVRGDGAIVEGIEREYRHVLAELARAGWR